MIMDYITMRGVTASEKVKLFFDYEMIGT